MNAVLTLRFNPTRTSRRGSAYVLVLMISMLVTIIGIAALTATRIQLRAAGLAGDADDAMNAARCGVELAQYWTAMDSTWRTARGNGTWASALSISGASVGIVASDPLDSDVTNSPLDVLQLDIVATKNKARQSLRVKLAANATPMTCMTTSVCSGGNINLGGSGRWTCAAPIASVSAFASGGAIVDSDVEAVAAINGTAIVGNKTSGATARDMPGSTVFSYFTSRGTAISYSTISGKLQSVVLSPGSNPYGSVNPEGIYVIDCGNKTIKIQNLRVVGTLVLLNAKSDSNINNEISFEPAVAGYPSLMVQGSFMFQFDSATLSEASISANLNPAGTPYNGVSNSTMTDSYASQIKGAIYVSGDLTMKKDRVLCGPLIVGGTITSDDALTNTWTATSATAAPCPGFIYPPVMRPLASSWTRLVN